MAVVNFYRTVPKADGGFAPADGYMRFRQTAPRVITGTPDNTVLDSAFTMWLVNGLASPDLAQTTSAWAWEVEEHVTGKDVVTYVIQVPSGAGPFDEPDLTRLDPSSLTPAPQYSTVNERLATLEAGGGGGGGAVSSVNSKTGAVVLSAADVGAAPASHTHTASQISDSTTTGRSVVTAADAAAARTAIGAGTSNLAIGTTAGTAAEGNDSRLSDARTPTAHTHNASDVNAGVLAVARLGSGTPAAGKYVDGGTGAWTTLPAGGGGASFPPVSGEALLLNPGTTSTPTWGPGVGRPGFTPIILDSPVNITSVSIWCSTLNASATMELGYYTNSGSTFTRGASFGTVALSSTGKKTLTGTWTLPAGLVWLAWLPLGATTNVYCTNSTPVPHRPQPFSSATNMIDVVLCIVGPSGQSSLASTYTQSPVLKDTDAPVRMLATVA